MRVSRATDLSVIHTTRAWPSALLMCAMCGKRTSARVGAFRLQQVQPAEGEWPPLACSGASRLGRGKGVEQKGGLRTLAVESHPCGTRFTAPEESCKDASARWV